MRQLVYQVCYIRYQVSFYLWWIGSLLKYCKVPKYYDQDCRSERTTPGFVVVNVKNLNLQYTAPRKEMKKPPTKKRKVQWSKFESRLVTSRCTAKGFLQNRLIGKASKKEWDSDITYIRNIFAFLTVWLNPIRIDAKLRRYSHPYAANWVYFMWDTMMPPALKQFINQEDIRSKLEWKIKENTTLNKVHEFLANANIDD